jgi:hypothetical protein
MLEDAALERDVSNLDSERHGECCPDVIWT